MKKFFAVILNKIRYPQGKFLVCFCIVFMLTVTGTVLLLVSVPRMTALHCVLYALSAVGLAYFIFAAAVAIAPKVKAGVIQVLQRHSFTAQILENYNLRTIVFATAGFCVNIAYAVFQTVAGILWHSAWNMAIALFCAVLIALKGGVLFCGIRQKTDSERQQKTCTVCGFMFNLLTMAIAGIVILANKEQTCCEYAGIMIYVVAAYTFWKIVSAIVRLARARRQDGVVIQAIRNINLVSALCSVLVLQIALIQKFGDGNQTVANAVTGGVVALLILSISICMYVKSARLKISRKNRICEAEEH